MKHRIIEGRLEYTSRKPEMEGQNRGFETFMFTHHSDGSVIMRAHCEIEEPEPTVMRDIVYAMDGNKQPTNLHVHLTVGDAFMGAGWMRFDGKHIEMESFGPSIGRLSQKVEAELPLTGFGTHPIVSDGYMLSTMEWAEGQSRLLSPLTRPSRRNPAANRTGQDRCPLYRQGRSDGACGYIPVQASAICR